MSIPPSVTPSNPAPTIFTSQDIQVDLAKGQLKVGGESYSIVLLDASGNKITTPLSTQNLGEIGRLAKEIFEKQNFTFSDLDGVIINNTGISSTKGPHVAQPLARESSRLYKQIESIVGQRLTSLPSSLQEPHAPFTEAKIERSWEPHARLPSDGLPPLLGAGISSLNEHNYSVIRPNEGQPLSTWKKVTYSPERERDQHIQITASRVEDVGKQNGPREFPITIPKPSGQNPFGKRVFQPVSERENKQIERTSTIAAEQLAPNEEKFRALSADLKQLASVLSQQEGKGKAKISYTKDKKKILKFKERNRPGEEPVGKKEAQEAVRFVVKTLEEAVELVRKTEEQTAACEECVKEIHALLNALKGNGWSQKVLSKVPDLAQDLEELEPIITALSVFEAISQEGIEERLFNPLDKEFHKIFLASYHNFASLIYGASLNETDTKNYFLNTLETIWNQAKKPQEKGHLVQNLLIPWIRKTPLSEEDKEWITSLIKDKDDDTTVKLFRTHKDALEKALSETNIQESEKATQEKVPFSSLYDSPQARASFIYEPRQLIENYTKGVKIGGIKSKDFPSQMAQDLAQISRHLFQSIPEREWSDVFLADGTALKTFEAYQINLKNFVIQTILEQPNKKAREKAIEFFMEMGKELSNMGDLTSAAAVKMAFSDSLFSSSKDIQKASKKLPSSSFPYDSMLYKLKSFKTSLSPIPNIGTVLAYLEQHRGAINSTPQGQVNLSLVQLEQKVTDHMQKLAPQGTPDRPKVLTNAAQAFVLNAPEITPSEVEVWRALENDQIQEDTLQFFQGLDPSRQKVLLPLFFKALTEEKIPFDVLKSLLFALTDSRTPFLYRLTLQHLTPKILTVLEKLSKSDHGINAAYQQLSQDYSEKDFQKLPAPDEIYKAIRGGDMHLPEIENPQAEIEEIRGGDMRLPEILPDEIENRQAEIEEMLGEINEISPLLFDEMRPIGKGDVKIIYSAKKNIPISPEGAIPTQAIRQGLQLAERQHKKEIKNLTPKEFEAITKEQKTQKLLFSYWKKKIDKVKDLNIDQINEKLKHLNFEQIKDLISCIRSEKKYAELDDKDKEAISKFLVFFFNKRHRLVVGTESDPGERKAFIESSLLPAWRMRKYINSRALKGEEWEDAKYLNIPRPVKDTNGTPLLIGDLFPLGDMVHASSALTTKNKAEGLATAAKGLRLLHEKNLVHGDLAARNILARHVLKNGKVTVRCALTDWDRAVNLEEGKTSKVITEERLPLRWIAPEVTTLYVKSLAELSEGSSTEISKASDIYSWGMTMIEIFTNAKLDTIFNPRNFGGVRTEYGDAIDHALSANKNNVDPETGVNQWMLDSLNAYTENHPMNPLVKNLILDCLKFDPAKRPSADGIVKRLEEISEQENLKEISEPKNLEGISEQKDLEEIPEEKDL